MAANDTFWLDPGVVECAPLPLSFPCDIIAMPLTVRLRLQLTEYNCVYASFFEEFAAADIETALQRLQENPSTWLIYEFLLDGAWPAFMVDADWPLLRRGRDTDIRTRDFPCDAEPWVWGTMVFSLRREPVTAYEGQLRLRVGGRNPGDAAQRWKGMADAIRPILRRLRSSRSS